ncbi:MAG: ABC transporter ATP-binding protein [Bacilli bacterium]|nr:ABC transporter ATP-binding protein [Bacilli bacterium]
MKKDTINNEIIKFISHNKNYCIYVFLKNILICFNLIITPYIIKNFIIYLENDNISFFIKKVLIIILLSFLLKCFSNIFGYLESKNKYKISIKMKLDFNKFTLNIPYSVYELSETQDMYNNAIYNLGNNTGIIAIVTNQISFISYFSCFTIIIPFLLLIDFYMALIIIVILILSILISIFQKRIEKNKYYNNTRIVTRKINYLNSICNNVSFAKEIRIFSLFDKINKMKKIEVDNYFKKLKDNQIIKSKLGIVKVLLEILEYLVCYVYFIMRYINNNIDTANFVYYITVSSSVIIALNQIISFIVSIINNKLYLKDLIDFKNKYIIGEKITNLKTIDEIELIEFKNVSFKYFDSNKYVLKNINLKISDEKIALVGLNGAGKTTLVKLLCGLYEPTEGIIEINGIDIKNIDKTCIFKYLDILFQNNPLLAISLKENILYENTEKENLSLLYKEIELNDNLINNIENGYCYSKELYSTGVQLSGGEIAKINILRIINSKKKFFIMDEPTAALDPFIEIKLYELLKNNMKNRFGLFITHRLNSITFCDKILLLEDGKIVENGSHDELIEKKGKYYELYNKQGINYRKGINEES